MSIGSIWAGVESISHTPNVSTIDVAVNLLDNSYMDLTNIIAIEHLEDNISVLQNASKAIKDGKYVSGMESYLPTHLSRKLFALENYSDTVKDQSIAEVDGAIEGFVEKVWEHLKIFAKAFKEHILLGITSMLVARTAIAAMTNGLTSNKFNPTLIGTAVGAALVLRIVSGIYFFVGIFRLFKHYSTKTNEAIDNAEKDPGSYDTEMDNLINNFDNAKKSKPTGGTKDIKTAMKDAEKVVDESKNNMEMINSLVKKVEVRVSNLEAKKSIEDTEKQSKIRKVYQKILGFLNKLYEFCKSGVVKSYNFVKSVYNKVMGKDANKSTTDKGDVAIKKLD
jgi:hypothetical protein